MAFIDKLKNAKDLATEFAEKAGEAAKTGISQAQTAVNEKMEQAKQSKLPQEGGLKRYEVTYRGGHPHFILDKKKSPYIIMDIMPDRFSFIPKQQSENWFSGFDIPFSKVISLEIVERTISTAESFLGSGSNNSDLRQKNVIEITYIDDENEEYVVRNEMLTGTTVMGQARVCQEMLDLLRINKITKLFKGTQDTTVNMGKSNGMEDIIGQIEKLSELKDKGILTEDEFINKKNELLAKL